MSQVYYSFSSLALATIAGNDSDLPRGAVADSRGVARDASSGGRADRASRTADSASYSGKRSNAPSRASASAESQRRLCALGEAAPGDADLVFEIRLIVISTPA